MKAGSVTLSNAVFCSVVCEDRGGCEVLMPRPGVMFWACIWLMWRDGGGWALMSGFSGCCWKFCSICWSCEQVVQVVELKYRTAHVDCAQLNQFKLTCWLCDDCKNWAIAANGSEFWMGAGGVMEEFAVTASLSGGGEEPGRMKEEYKHI